MSYMYMQLHSLHTELTEEERFKDKTNVFQVWLITMHSVIQYAYTDF